AVGEVTAVHTELLRVAGDAAGSDSSIVEIERPAVTPAPTAGGDRTLPEDFAESRETTAERYRSLVGNPDIAPLSYFERTGTVPAHFMATPYESGGPGVVTGSMLREAELAMASSRPSGDLNLPPLSDDNIAELIRLGQAGDADAFLNKAEGLRFQPEKIVQNPGRRVLEMLLHETALDDRAKFLTYFDLDRRESIERIWADQATTTAQEEWTSRSARNERDHWLRENPKFDQDLRFLRQLLVDDPKNLQPSLDNLGYGVILERWHTANTARLDAVLSRLDGDQINELVGKMDGDKRQRFLTLLRRSDLRPQTRAKLAGQVVDNNFFWRQQEELVESLVTGMNAADLRIFFDQLHTDGKLEDFLKPSSFWRLLFVILTFGLALLFLHDNEAALRVVAAQGWSSDELMAEYGTKLSFTARTERKAEEYWFNASINTIPMDPQIRGALRAVHNVLGNVKVYHFADLPEEAARVVQAMALGAGKQLSLRIGDVAKQGGSVGEMVDEYKKFFAGLSPAAVARQFETGDTDGSAAVVAKALADGAVAGLISAAADPRNRFITTQLLMDIILATNDLDSPITFEVGGFDPRVDQQDYEELVEKAAFFGRYTGFDFSQAQLIYGGLTTTMPAITFGPTISISPERAPMTDGKFRLSDGFQQVIAFHETAHILQQMMYGARVNAFIDQGIHIHASGDRGRAYRVTEQMFDDATSIHDFQEHWEQQAELIEQSMRMLWARSRKSGHHESYPGGGFSLQVGGGRIELTPERWAKMVRFVKEFGDAARRALGTTGGQFRFQGTHGVG
ncbi:MAG: hypothetical protein V3T05_10350, partial [Myxococcota bacterium]